MQPARRQVSEIMHREVATLTPDDKLDLGDDIMNLGRVRHMPVLEGERLVGMVSQRDVLSASLSRALEFEASSRRSFLRSVEVREVMAKNVVSIAPDATLAEAAQLMLRCRIGALPVLGKDGALVGLLSQTDLLSAAYGLEDESASAPTGERKESAFAKWLEEEFDDVRRVRDELNVRMHLAKAEVRDRWQELEHGFSKLEARARRVARVVEEPLEKFEEDARKLVADLRDGYRRIRDSL